MKITSLMVIPEQWVVIQRLAASEGVSGSAYVRQMIARELRAAVADGRLPSEPAPGQKKARK